MSNSDDGLQDLYESLAGESKPDTYPVMYLAGPIGRPTCTAEWEQLAERIGYAAMVQGKLAQAAKPWLVINPYASAQYEGNFNIPWDTWMIQGILIVERIADAICMLPGWQDSPGARIELGIARACGRQLYEWRDESGLAPLE